MAATNYVDGLEPTLIREGRFDAKLRLGLPGEDGRKEILGAQLAMLALLAWRKHDLANVARRTPGWSPARLSSLVDRATLLARREGALRNVREFKQIHRMYFGRAPA